MSRVSVNTDQAPAAIGPYNQAIRVDTGEVMLFCSGQIGVDPKTQTLVDGGVEAETRCALDNLKSVLGAAGFALRDVVRTTIYLTDIQDFERVNRAYEEYFPNEAPARVTIAVSALPKAAAVEIDATAVKD